MNLVIGIDVAKGNSTATACSSLDQVFDQFKFMHTNTGLRALQQVLDRLEHTTNQRPEIILEATGQYSMPLYRYFQENRYVCHIINPYLASKFSQCKLRKVKTDKIDSKALCKLYYVENLAGKRPQSQTQNSLKSLVRVYEMEKQAMVTQKVQWLSLLDRCFPGFTTLFHDSYGRESLLLLQTFPHPGRVVHLRLIQINHKIQKLFPRRKPDWVQELVDRLTQVAAESYPAVVEDDLLIPLLVQSTQRLQIQIDLVKQLLDQLNDKASRHPQFAALAAIPGFGKNQAARFLAMIGDLNRFATAKQLIAFCGCDPAVHQSGKFTGNRQHLTKHGDPQLRTLLYMAVMSMTQFGHNPVLQTYFQKKRLTEGKPFGVAVFACANKLLRIIFSVSRQTKPLAG